MTLDRCFDLGMEVMQDRYGAFKHEPSWKRVPGLIEEDRANGYTKSRIPREQHGNVVLIDDDAIPMEIGLDESLVEKHPKKACKTLAHELVEWRAAERMPSVQVHNDKTDYVAEFAEDGICRDINERADAEICDTEWSSEYP